MHPSILSPADLAQRDSVKFGQVADDDEETSPTTDIEHLHDEYDNRRFGMRGSIFLNFMHSLVYCFPLIFAPGLLIC